jgi:hypothetical protein
MVGAGREELREHAVDRIAGRRTEHLVRVDSEEQVVESEAGCTRRWAAFGQTVREQHDRRVLGQRHLLQGPAASFAQPERGGRGGRRAQ